MTDRLKYLQLAKELTGSTDIDEIIKAAKQLESYDSPNNTSDLGIPPYVTKFIGYTRIQHPIRGPIPFEMHPFQRRMAENLGYSTYGNGKHQMFNLARQMGTTSVMAMFAMWAGMQTKNTTIHIVSYNMAQSQEVLDRMQYGATFIPHTFGGVLYQKYGEICFWNRAKIVSTTYSKLSKIEPGDIVICMEMAYMSWKLDESVLKALEEIDKAGGRIIIASTPNEPKGLFYDLWSDEKTTHNFTKPVKSERTHLKFDKHSIHWKDHPDRDESWASGFRQQLGPIRFAREFENQFISG